jgi:cobalt-zinc-cadmium efflux system membrane fusion protein
MKYLICTIAVLSFLACGGKQQDQQSAGTETPPETHVSLSKEQLQNAKLETGMAEKGDISSTLRLSGTIDVPPQNMVSVSFPLGGYLKSTRLLPGMRVRKGEVLAVMEDAQFIQLQQEYLLTKSKLTLTEAEFQRQQTLNAGKAASDKVLQQAKSEFEAQRITQRALAEKLRLIGLEPEKLSEENLSRTVNVYSPISGYVAKVDVNIGKYTAPTDVLFELVNPEDIHLNLTGRGVEFIFTLSVYSLLSSKMKKMHRGED